MLIVPVTLFPALAPKETGGSPEFPGYPFAHMPRSQTPVGSHLLALAQIGLLPSGRCIPSALDSVARTYLLSTIIHFSGFNDAACVLALPLLRTLLFSSRTSVQLPTGWLAFGRVGLECSSHPLGNFDMFQEVSPLFSRPEFSSARAVGLLAATLLLPNISRLNLSWFALQSRGNRADRFRSDLRREAD